MFTSAAILLSHFGAERSGRGGGGTPDIIHAYVRWGGGGATGPQNAWGILRVKLKI